MGDSQSNGQSTLLTGLIFNLEGLLGGLVPVRVNHSGHFQISSSIAHAVSEVGSSVLTLAL